jgi:hypothetical protein
MLDMKLLHLKWILKLQNLIFFIPFLEEVLIDCSLISSRFQLSSHYTVTARTSWYSKQWGDALSLKETNNRGAKHWKWYRIGKVLLWSLSLQHPTPVFSQCPNRENVPVGSVCYHTIPVENSHDFLCRGKRIRF